MLGYTVTCDNNGWSTSKMETLVHMFELQRCKNVYKSLQVCRLLAHSTIWVLYLGQHILMAVRYCFKLLQISSKFFSHLYGFVPTAYALLMVRFRDEVRRGPSCIPFFPKSLTFLYESLWANSYKIVTLQISCVFSWDWVRSLPSCILFIFFWKSNV